MTAEGAAGGGPGAYDGAISDADIERIRGDPGLCEDVENARARARELLERHGIFEPRGGGLRPTEGFLGEWAAASGQAGSMTAGLRAAVRAMTPGASPDVIAPVCAFATELLQGSRPGDALNEEAAEAIRRGGIRMTHGEAAASARRFAAALGGGP